MSLNVKKITSEIKKANYVSSSAIREQVATCSTFVTASVSHVKWSREDAFVLLLDARVKINSSVFIARRGVR